MNVIAEQPHPTAKLKSTEEVSVISDVALVRRTYSILGIEPKMSVIRPHVKMVDANLAYKYVDLQSDHALFLSFTTLFLGICIASLISLIISILSSPIDRVVIAIHISSFILTLVVTIIFWVFTLSAAKKAKVEKEKLETTQGITELDLSLRTNEFIENEE